MEDTVTKQCSRCKKVYPDTPKNFPPKGSVCRPCQRAYNKKWREEHRERIAARGKKYYEEHREQVATQKRKYREEHQEQIKAQQRVYQRAYRKEHQEQIRAYRKKHLQRGHEYQKAHRRQLRLEVLNHYAPDGLRCTCCGEDHVEFLCIDHINGGGGQHRKSIKGSLYSWLKKRGFPKGFRVLCLNCNGSLGHYGYCPHKL